MLAPAGDKAWRSDRRLIPPPIAPALRPPRNVVPASRSRTTASYTAVKHPRRPNDRKKIVQRNQIERNIVRLEKKIVRASGRRIITRDQLQFAVCLLLNDAD